ncbi:MAG: PilZ domain-containing protein [Kofleriaceae bacterium]|jgi:CheY-like chemotaxis protein|nr:PilZ domain-containing protein [Kofleriaceae bacterium]MBP9166830.1 PilZ domain-containing protein [Kofleriaceae bacterium]MBP9857066.1 PilZ domain-containing protein [Kofleriaceae bacterium]
MPVRVVATGNPEVCRHLAAPPVARAGVTWEVAADVDALVAACRAAPPAIALIDAEAFGDGYAACRALRDDPATAAVRRALIAPPTGLTRAAAAAVAAAGCDELLASPLAFTDFCTHLDRLAPVSVRRDRRIEVAVAAELGAPPLAATIANVGPGGVGLRTPVALAVGAAVTVRLRGEPEPGPGSVARVAWCRPTGDPAAPFACGVAWDGEPALRTRLLLEQVALYDLEPGPDAVTVTVHGDLTELTRFAPLAAALVGATAITFDLAAVRYVSSAGVRAWCELIAGLAGATVRFRHCSLPIVTQAAMVPLVLGHGAVESLAAPYYCEACGHDDERLLEVGAIAWGDGPPLAPSLACPRCGGPAELDDLPERYLAFLAER